MYMNAFMCSLVICLTYIYCSWT